MTDHRRRFPQLACRHVVAAAVLAGACSVSGRHAEPRTRDAADTCRQFVQSFYDWYLPVAANDTPTPAWVTAVEERPAWFDPALSRALISDAEAQRTAVGEIVGLDTDPFLLSQDVDSRDRYVVIGATVKDDMCTVAVRRTGERIHPFSVHSVLRARNSRWAFVDFDYPDSPESLVALLKQLAASRRRE